MQIWLLLLIVFAIAIVVGCIVGLIVGKALVNKANPNGRRSLFSRGESIVLLAMVLVGIGAILFGVFYTPGGNYEPDFWAGDREMMFTPDYGGMYVGRDMTMFSEYGTFEGEDLPDDEFLANEEDSEYIAESAIAETSSPPARPSGGAAPRPSTPRPAARSGGSVVIVG